jgi:hypothetical protein
VCAPQLTATDVNAVIDAASAVQAAAKNLEKDDSFWASVGTNVFSNRLDTLLFGQGPESQGLVALFAAWFTLAAALVKLALAWNLPSGSSGPPSNSRRFVEITLSLVLCVSGALAVLAVHTARSASVSDSEPRTEFQSDLLACQRDLQSALTRSAGLGIPAAAPIESLKRIEAACVATGTETKTKLTEFQSGLDDIRSNQVGFLIKLMIFLGFCGVAALVWRTFFK